MVKRVRRDVRQPVATFDPVAVPAGPVRFAPSLRTARELLGESALLRSAA